MSIDNIRSFADRFAEIVFNKYPEWKQYRIEPDLQWQSKGDLVIEVPSRFAPNCPLRIETMDDGIVIYWLGGHMHCDDWNGTHTEEEFISEAFDIIDGILTEKLVFVIGPENGVGTCTPDTLDENWQKGFWGKAGEKDKFVTVSWNGNYDRGQFDPAKC